MSQVSLKNSNLFFLAITSSVRVKSNDRSESGDRYSPGCLNFYENLRSSVFNVLLAAGFPPGVTLEQIYRGSMFQVVHQREEIYYYINNSVNTR